VYDSESRNAIVALDGQIDSERATAAWEAALAAPWHGPSVWVHGDMAPGTCWSEMAGFVPCSTLGVQPLAIPRVTWCWRGRSCPARAGKPSGLRSRSTRGRGHEDEAGRCGRP
jgi:hypothetical protein